VSGLRLRSLRALVFRAPVAAPVTTSFGTMRDRPCVLVRAEDAEGRVGWGEIWCNFPAVGPEYRAGLVDSLFAPLVENRSFDDPAAAFHALTAETAVLALQCGEPGPFAQCIAGIDIALWDLAAQAADQPLWRMLGGHSPALAVYASGLNPDDVCDLAVACQAAGHRAFKLKLGFGAARDIAGLQALRTILGPEATLMADVNQGWTLTEALDMAPALDRFGLDWLEEPLRADRPWSEWQALAARVPARLAAGENIAGETNFHAAIDSGTLGVVQPDVGKWGGFTGTLPVAKRILSAGLRYCPHWLGGGIGLLASAHLLAAVGGDGLLEIDANPNPLRTALAGPLDRVADGRAALTEAPGLGTSPDLDALQPYRVQH